MFYLYKEHKNIKVLSIKIGGLYLKLLKYQLRFSPRLIIIYFTDWSASFLPPAAPAKAAATSKDQPKSSSAQGPAPAYETSQILPKPHYVLNNYISRSTPCLCIALFKSN